MVISLTSSDPHQNKNVVRFNNTEHEFAVCTLSESTILHFEQHGTCLHMDSEEGIKQREKEMQEKMKNRRGSKIVGHEIQEEEEEDEGKKKKRKVSYS